MAGRKKGDGRPVKTTLSGFNLWAFERYRDAHGKEDGPALRSIVELWLKAEKPDYLASFGVSLDAYRRERGDNVVAHRKPATVGKPPA